METINLEIDDKEKEWIDKIQKWQYNICLNANDANEKRVHVHQYFSKQQGIYIFQNETDKKKYIGSTTFFQKRITSHIGRINHNKHDNLKFQNAVKAHGWLNFKIYLFVIPKLTRDELFDIETKMIIYYDSFKNGYNKVVDSRCQIFTDAQRKEIGKRLSKANKGIPKSEEHRKKCGIAISKTNSGEGNPLAKFTKEQVLEIRKTYTQFSLKELAEKYNVSKRLISDILKLRRYNYPDYVPENYQIPKVLGNNWLFNKEDVLFIREHVNEFTIKELSIKYSCSRHVISNIIHLRTYLDPDWIPINYCNPK